MIPDPTWNVRELVAAETRRQDDLRILTDTHSKEVGELRAHFSAELRKAEAARIDAIRAVDVGNVQRAAEVQAAQAATLAAQVAASAETLRTQVAAAATAAAVALAAALEPVQKDIADLRRVQYEGVGQKTQVVETRSESSDARAQTSNTTAIIAAIVGALVLVVLVTGLYLSNRPTETPQQPVTVTIPGTTTPTP